MPSLRAAISRPPNETIFGASRRRPARDRPRNRGIAPLRKASSYLVARQRFVKPARRIFLRQSKKVRPRLPTSIDRKSVSSLSNIGAYISVLATNRCFPDVHVSRPLLRNRGS